MFKWNGKLGRLSLNPFLLLLLMTQSPVQHTPNSMTSLVCKDGVGSGTMPEEIKSLQGQSNKAKSGKSEYLKPTCLGT